MSLEGRPGLLTAPAVDLEPPFPDMVWVPGTTYLMGSDRHYPEERPAHRVSVDGFWMDRYPVTNERFARFVAETGHVTLAEIAPDPAQYPGALPHMLYAGSLVFVQPEGPVDRANIGNWWTFKRGADWRHPQGPSSSIEGSTRHPVVHVAFADAEAFAAWEGKALPTRGGMGARRARRSRGAAYAWGDEFLPGDRHMANTWQGEFPWQNLQSDGYARTSPVDAFPANGYGLLDMIGNVWEWTTDWYVPRHPGEVIKACCTPQQSPRTARDRELRSAPAGDPHPPQGDQGRLAPLRAELLPQIPAGGALPGAGRHVHVSPRLPLHRPAERAAAGRAARVRPRVEPWHDGGWSSAMHAQRRARSEPPR